MRWGWLIALIAALSGCKSLERAGLRDREKSPGDTASRTKTRPETKEKSRDPHWLDGPTGTPTAKGDLPAKRPGPPPADSWADPRDPNYDVRTEVKGVLAGYVEDPDRRKLADVFIEVQLANPPAGSGAPVGVQTDSNGTFLIKGLKEGESYVLTAKTTREGRAMAGQVYAKPPNVYVRLALIEGLTLPTTPSLGNPPAVASGPDPRPGGPSPVLPSPAPLSRDATVLPLPGPSDPVGDGAFSPTGPSRPAPTPSPSPTPTPATPARVVPGRPDLTTDGPKPDWRPPTTTIPSPNLPMPGTGSGSGLGPSALPPPPPTRNPGPTQSRSVQPRSEFVLVDTTGRTREFPSGRANDLILLDFMTTTCVPCKKIVPTLRALQAKYGTHGLEVVGVCCDEAEMSTRRALAAEYQRNYSLNYLVYTEPGPRPGAIMKKFRAEFYPTLVLLDGTGEEVWRGDSRDLGKLEDVIRSRLSR